MPIVWFIGIRKNGDLTLQSQHSIVSPRVGQEILLYSVDADPTLDEYGRVGAVLDEKVVEFLESLFPHAQTQSDVYELIHKFDAFEKLMNACANIQRCKRRKDVL